MPISLYSELLECLPLDTITFGFAYGSGAISQSEEDISDKMIDYIIVSNDSLKFHQDNLIKNPKHYSYIRLLGPDKVTKLQQNMGARIYFNTNVKTNNRLIKYGVISTDSLQEDLLDWSWMYVAGRLQKPVIEVIEPNNAIKTQIKENRLNALQAALLQLPDLFTKEKLFEKIVSLSYNGDFRMLLGEDKKKIIKIVKGGYDKLDELYSPLLENDQRLIIKGNKIEQDNSTPAIYHRLNLLPLAVLNGLKLRTRAWDKRERDIEEMLFTISHRNDIGDHLAATMSSIVRTSSISQTFKNAITAGFVKSVVYSSKKIVKMMKSIH